MCFNRLSPLSGLLAKIESHCVDQAGLDCVLLCLSILNAEITDMHLPFWRTNPLFYVASAFPPYYCKSPSTPHKLFCLCLRSSA